MSKYTAYIWPEETRDLLLVRFRPAYPDVVAHHITVAHGVPPETPPPPQPNSVAIVGRCDDGAGLEALIVSLDDSTKRADGKTYHITWSLDRARGRRPHEANDMIAACGFTPVDPVRIRVLPVVLDDAD
ncbi:MAG: hypothetical protein QNJ94_20460 [Alphaproteobacteria bacterium]|nr:hypothetical protein [Alphaproteobacteria bacterium]